MSYEDFGDDDEDDYGYGSDDDDNAELQQVLNKLFNLKNNLQSKKNELSKKPDTILSLYNIKLILNLYQLY